MNIKIIRDYFVFVDEKSVEVFLYKWNTNEDTRIQIRDKNTNQPLKALTAKINEKSITFKKKEKDFLIL